MHMRRWLWRIGLFLLAWLAVRGETGLDAGSSLIVLLLLWVGVRLALKLGMQLLAQVGLDNWWSIAKLAIWIALCLWLVPETLASRHLAMAVASAVLVMVGAGFRLIHERRPKSRAIIRDIGIALCLLALVTCTAISWAKGDGLVPGLWLLLVLALLLGIPLSFGWKFVNRAAPKSADAKLGDFDDLKDAGLSDER
jgi:hypothetical protein